MDLYKGIGTKKFGVQNTPQGTILLDSILNPVFNFGFSIWVEVSHELGYRKFGGSVMPLHSLILLDLSPIVDSFSPKFDSQPTGLLDLGVFFFVLGLIANPL